MKPSPSSSTTTTTTKSTTTHSTTATTTTPTTITTTTSTGINQDEDRGLVYWDEHHQLIDQVKQQHVISPPSNNPNLNPKPNSQSKSANPRRTSNFTKRNSTLAGIPSPSKSASEPHTKEHSPLVDSLNLQNNHKPLRFSKRRKSKIHSDQPVTPNTSSNPQPPLISKQKAWAELTNRLKRRQLDGYQITPNPPPRPQTRLLTHNKPDLKIPTTDSRRVFTTSSSSLTRSNHTSDPPNHTTTSTNQPLISPNHPPPDQHKTNELQIIPNPKSTTTTITSSQRQNPIESNQAQLRHSCEPIREVEEDASSHKAGSKELASTKHNGKMTDQAGGVGCEPWELDEDPAFGSQLLQLADLVEKEQKASQETAVHLDMNQESSVTTITTTKTKTATVDQSSSSKPLVTPHPATTASWKSVTGPNKRPSNIINQPPLPPVLATKTNTIHNRTLMKQPSAVLIHKQSSIIYKTAVISKATLTTPHKNSNTLAIKGGLGKAELVIDGRRNLGGGGSNSSSSAKDGLKLAGDGTTTATRASATKGAHQVGHPPGLVTQKLSYSDALIRPCRSVRVVPQKPIPSLTKNLPVISPHHADLDLDSLFCGIQGDDLDWDPNDQ